MTEREIRRRAIAMRNEHDPEQQPGNDWSHRCQVCNYMRHPCMTYSMTTALLRFLDDDL